MRFLFVTREGYRQPGGRIRCFDIAEGLQALGAQARVLSMADHLGAGQGKDEAGMGIFKKTWVILRALPQLLFTPRKTIWVVNRVHYHAIAPLLAGFLVGRRTVLDMDDWEFREDTPLDGGFRTGSKGLWLTRLLARRAGLTFASSRFLHEVLAAFTPNAVFLPSGVNLRRVDAPGPAAASDPGIVLGWLGTVHREEDVEDLAFLLRAFAHVAARTSGVRLEITGDGVRGSQLQTLLDAMPPVIRPRVRWLGWAEPDAVVPWMRRVHVALHPLVRENRFTRGKCPVSLLEWMACRKPVVTHATGECGRLVTHGVDGLIARTETDFADAVLRLVADEGLREALGSAARRKMETQYDTRVLAGRFLDEARRRFGEDRAA